MDSDTANTPPPVDTYGTDSDRDSDLDRDSESNTLVNGLIGGGVGIVLSFVPGATLLGGAVAGYLEGGELENALSVGAIAGVVMLVPFLLLALFAITVLGIVEAGAFSALFVLILLAGALYSVGLSIIGAVIGIVLSDEF